MQTRAMKQRGVGVGVLVVVLAGLVVGCGTPRLRPLGEVERDIAPIKERAMESQVESRLRLAAEPRDGGTIVMRQPTEDEIRVFAQDGGRVVVNLRTSEEMSELGFDERALVEGLGMGYVWLPTKGSAIDLGGVEAFGRALESWDGVLLHCASGGRASGVWAAHLCVNEGLGRTESLERGRAVGLEGRMAEIAERVMLRAPDRALSSIDPSRIRACVDALAGFGTRHTMSDTASSVRGIGAARRWVASAFEDAVRGSGRDGALTPTVSFDAHTVEPDGRRILERVEIVNVVCTIPGADPASRGRLYYAVAHLDSRASDPNDGVSDAPGANDDASGVAALIELARVLSNERLDATVVLMATSGEEQGLFGARLHAEAARAGGLDIRAVLNNDTIGSPIGVNGREDRARVRVFSQGLALEQLSDGAGSIAPTMRATRSIGGESDAPSRQLARYIHTIGELHRAPVRAMLVMRPDRFLRGGDHTAFDAVGYPAVRLCEVHENYAHQHQDVRTEGGVVYGDLAEFVDEGYLADVTRLNAAALVHLCNAPSVPGNARVLAAELADDTTLRWDASPEPDVAGYEIVWRETTSPVWQESMDVGNTTEATVDLSKDNWYFGVRAYDRDGYRSPVAFPAPARE